MAPRIHDADQCFDSEGSPVNLGPVLYRGGEARIQVVVDRPELVAKIYHVPRPGYVEKLRWMIAHPPPAPSDSSHHPSIAWPQGIVLDSANSLAGYLMPRVDGAVTLLNVFSPRLRGRVLPGFNWKYLHRAATNLASALQALHQGNYVVGDLNESNALVTPSALVTLIDVDSFQVRRTEDDGYKIIHYPCPVGRYEYTPPELQGEPLRGLVRRPEQDAFGLAVLIFQLLMNGSHPFRCTWRGGERLPPIEERIRRGWFPYSAERMDIVQPPPGLSLDILHPTIASLVNQAFVDGHREPGARPDAGAWRRALAHAEASLVECARGHRFSPHRDCPWCRALGKSAHSTAAPAPAMGDEAEPAPPVQLPREIPTSAEAKPVPAPRAVSTKPSVAKPSAPKPSAAKSRTAEPRRGASSRATVAGRVRRLSAYTIDNVFIGALMAAFMFGLVTSGWVEIPTDEELAAMGNLVATQAVNTDASWQGFFGNAMLALVRPFLLAWWMQVVLYFVYMAGFWAWRGQTPAKVLMGLRVVQRDGSPPSLAAALVRCGGYCLSQLLLGLPFLLVLIDSRRRGLHDRLAGTEVVSSALVPPQPIHVLRRRAGSRRRDAETALLALAFSLAVAIAIPLLPERDYANMIPNGGFEEPVVRTAASQTYGVRERIGPWRVSSGTVDLVTNRRWPAAEGNQSLELGAHKNTGGRIWMMVSLEEGKRYVLRFALAGDPQGGPEVKRVYVTWGDKAVDSPTVSVSRSSRDSMAWQFHEYRVVASEPATRLMFHSTISTGHGPVIDDVTLAASQNEE